MRTPERAAKRAGGGRGESPHLAALGGAARHRRSVSALEGGRELSEVRQRPIHAESRRSMRVGGDQQAKGLGPVVRAPRLREADEELLLGAEASALGRRRPRLLGS